MEFHWETRQEYIIAGNEKRKIEEELQKQKEQKEEEAKRKKELEKKLMALAEQMDRMAIHTIKTATPQQSIVPERSQTRIGSLDQNRNIMSSVNRNPLENNNAMPKPTNPNFPKPNININKHNGL